MSDADNLRAILQRRASCRAFLDKPVATEQISGALADAQQVPSWCNSQPWHVTACSYDQTAKLREALSAHVLEAAHHSDIPFPERYEGIYKQRRSVCGWQLYDAVGVQKGDRAGSAKQMRENFRLFGAPHFVLVTTPKALGAYGVLDCGSYVTATLLALEARGIGAIAMASVAGFAPFMRDWFDVGEDRDVLCGISLGYPDRDHPANSFRTDRAPSDEVVVWK